MRYFVLVFVMSLLLWGDSWPNPEEALNGLQQITRQYIGVVETGIEGLALSDDIKTMEWERAKGLLAEFEEEWFITFLIRPDGTYFRPGIGLTDQNLKDREYFPMLMAGECFTDQFYVGRTSAKKSMMLGCPVKKDGQVVGALGAAIFLDEIGNMIREGMVLDESSIFFIMNSDSMAIISSDNTDDFTYPAKLGNPSLERAVLEIFERKNGQTSYIYDGSERDVYYLFDEELGWYFVYGHIEQRRD